jgi:hypothetical protein
MTDEVKRLTQLLDACHRVLPNLGDRDDDLAQAIRTTCIAVQEHLRELGVAYMEAV